MPKIAVIYYSATGTNHTIAQAVAEGATGAGAETRVRLIAETAPAAAIDSNPKWRAFVDKTANEPKASLDDLDWADGIVFGVPTRFGSPAAQFKQFIDTAGGLWFQGKLADKVYAAFTSAQNAHGGQEATLLSLYTTIHHFGGIIAGARLHRQARVRLGWQPLRRLSHRERHRRDRGRHRPREVHGPARRHDREEAPRLNHRSFPSVREPRGTLPAWLFS
jgi:NAD(P)H dehydrogenase (quinone)